MISAPVPILLYHSVGWTDSDRYRRWVVAPSAFAEQLDVVAELGHTCLTVSGYVARRAAGTLPDLPLLITFDDGRADVVEHAAPALAERALPATVYLVSGSIGGSSTWLDDPVERLQPMMTWTDACDLIRAGVEIGSHSESHRELDVLGLAERRHEVARSGAMIADRTGHEVQSFAYPHGYHSAAVVREVVRAGYRSACAVKDCWSAAADDPFALSRLVVPGDLDIDAFRSLLSTSVRPTAPAHGAVARLGWRAWRWARHHGRAA